MLIFVIHLSHPYFIGSLWVGGGGSDRQPAERMHEAQTASLNPQHSVHCLKVHRRLKQTLDLFEERLTTRKGFYYLFICVRLSFAPECASAA